MEKVLVRMPKELKEELVKSADKKGISLNAQMLLIAWDWLNKND